VPPHPQGYARHGCDGSDRESLDEHRCHHLAPARSYRPQHPELAGALGYQGPRRCWQ